MGEFMPQRTRPVEALVDAPRGRTVHGDHIAEGRAEDADPRQARRAHREIVVVRIKLDRHRLPGHVVVALAKHPHGVRDQSAHVSLEGAGFVAVGAQDEQFVFAEIEPVQAVQQPQRVDHFGVVRVAVVRACQVSARIVETVHAQQVHAERRVRAEQTGVDGDRAFEQRDRLLVAAGDDVEVGDGLEQCAIAGVHFEHALRPRARGQTLKMVPGREQRHRLQARARVVGLHDREQHLLRVLHIPDHERQARQHETRPRAWSGARSRTACASARARPSNLPAATSASPTCASTWDGSMVSASRNSASASASWCASR